MGYRPLGMLRLDGLTKRYGETLALDDVTLHVDEGERLSLVGTSGSGKSTLLKLLNRLEEPTSGRVTLAGKDIAAEDPVKLRRRLGYVIQSVGLFPHMSVAENITLVMRLEGKSEKARAERVRDLLELVRLPKDFFGRSPASLSGGQAQRVGLARALALDPEVILMDEPFGALDPLTRRHMRREICELFDRGANKKTVILVTHDLDEAFEFGHRTAVLHDGKLHQVGTREALASDPQTAFVAAFVEAFFGDGHFEVTR